jgi:hypothetical protein
MNREQAEKLTKDALDQLVGELEGERLFSKCQPLKPQVFDGPNPDEWVLRGGRKLASPTGGVSNPVTWLRQFDALRQGLGVAA